MLRHTITEQGSVAEKSGGPDVAALRRCFVFKALGHDDAQRLAAASRVRTYRRGELIFPAHDRSDCCFFVAYGAVKVYRLAASGQEVTIEIVLPGEVYGMVMLEDEGTWDSFLAATVDHTVVYHVPLDTVKELCLRKPQFALAVLRLLSRRLREARDRIEDFALYDVKERLAHTLASLALDHESHAVMQTHRELAGLVGTRPEEVTRSLRHLRQQGLIAYEPRRPGIVALDVEQLATYGGRTP